MSDDTHQRSIVCAKCKTTRESGSQACACGSRDVIHAIVVTDTLRVGVHDGFGLKVGPKVKSGPGSKRRWQREVSKTTEGYHQTDRLVERTNDVDRIRNLILERLVDTKTGEALKDGAEVLTDHKDHGDAKPGRRKR